MADVTGTANQDGAGAQDEQRAMRVALGRMFLDNIADQLEDLRDALREASDDKAERFFAAMSDPAVVKPLFDGFLPLAQRSGVPAAEVEATRQQLEVAISVGGGR